MSPDLSVIVVSYNARELLGDCIDAVLADAEASQITVELLVVDNDSSDDSVSWTRRTYPESSTPVRVIEAGRNGGMAAGNNVGMLAARADAMLLLNSDAMVRPGALRAMLDAVDDGSRVGMVGPRLLNLDGSLQRSVRGFPSVWRLVTEFWYLRRLAPGSRLFNAFYAGDFDHRSARDVDWVMGACMLVPRAVVDDVGLMDEGYFMFGEETDWAARMHRAGWRVRFDPAAEVVHLGGGSTAKQWGRMYEVQVVNHVRYLARNVSLRAARRGQRAIASALGFRALLYRALSFLPGGRAARRSRAVTFAAGRRAVRAPRVADLAGSDVPAWPAH